MHCHQSILLVWCRGILWLNQAAWVANKVFCSAFGMQCTHADLALQDEDMEEYDDDEEAEELDEDDMGDDDEEEEDEEEEDEEEEQDGLPFTSPYHIMDKEEEEDEEEEDDNEEEEGAEGLLEVDAEDEGEEEEEMDDDAFEVEVPPGAGWDQFEHMLGSGSPATRARRMELAGKSAFCCC